MSRIKYRSAEVWEKRRRFARRMTLIFSISIILIVVGTIFFLRAEAIQIRDINIEGTNIIDKKEIKEFVDASLSGNYLWVIPKSNTFLYSVKDLNNALVKKFPGIFSLNVGREGFKKVYIKIVERKPQALWCKNVEDENPPDCYFVDTSGVVFAKAPFFSGNVYFVYKGDLGKEDPLGAQIFTAQDFSEFEAFVTQVGKKLNISIVGVELKDQGDFDFLLSSGARIMLNKNISYDDMFNNMDAVLKSKEFSSSTINSLDYMDMRFGNKVYYKAKSAPKF
ncbi:MAG: hypothetical protein WCJ74_03340 [bacterium]